MVEFSPKDYAKNVDFEYPQVIQMLTDIGFKEITKQYEMAREIPAESYPLYSSLKRPLINIGFAFFIPI